MNKIFKVIYSKTKHMYVVASELAKSHSKSKNEGATSGKALAALVMAALASASFMAAPMTAQAKTETKGWEYIGIRHDSDESSANYKGAGSMGDNSITIGKNAKAGDGTITIGDRRADVSKASVYVGQGDIAKPKTDTGAWVTSVGYNSDATGYGSIAIGSNAVAKNSYDKDASGNNIQYSKTYTDTNGKPKIILNADPGIQRASVALGYGASADNGNIAIGSYSDASTDLRTAKTKDGKEIKSYLTDKMADSYVSVGDGKDHSETQYRRISNVADGASASDVATVGQLQALSDKVGVYDAGFGIKIASDKDNKTNTISLNRNLGTNYGNPWKGEGKVTFEAGGENSMILGGAASILFNNEEDNVKAGAYGKDSVLVGGFNNLIDTVANDVTQTGEDAVIVGGDTNTVTGLRSVIVGGSQNKVSGGHSIVIGGASNETDGGGAGVFGGQLNKAAGGYSSVLGGDHNEADGDWSSAIGGTTNTASGLYATTLGGKNNDAKGKESVVVGGGQNVAIGEDSTVNGGAENTSYGMSSYAAGGMKNMAFGNASVALGGINSNVNAKVSTGIAGGSTEEKAITALAAGHQSVVTNSGVEWRKATQEDFDAINQKLPSWSGFIYTEPEDPYTTYVLDKVSTAVGYQSTADAPGVIAFGHDKGDVASVAKKWKQKATMEVDDNYSAKYYDANHKEISADDYYKLANADGTWNDYTQDPIGTENTTYQSAYYNRLVKAADGIDAHDAVVMEQLKPYTKSDASNVGANLKTYTVGDDGETITETDASNTAKTTNENAWGEALGTGSITNDATKGSKQLVTGGTVYSEVRPTTDGTYVKTAQTTAQNLSALDTQVKKNADDLSTMDSRSVKYDLKADGKTVDKTKITLGDGTNDTTVTHVKSALADAKDSSSKAATVATATGDALKNAVNLGDLQTAYTALDSKAGAHTALTVEGGTQANGEKDKDSKNLYAGKNIQLHSDTDATTGKVTYDVKLAKDLTGITSITSQTTGNTTGAKITLNTTDKNISVNDGKITDVKSGLTATDGTYAETDKSNAANIGDVHSMIEKEAGNTDTKLAEKANVDASNIGIHVSNDTAKQKENLDKWGAAIGTGEVADATNTHANQLVTGKTVYDALHGGLDNIVIGKPGKDGAAGTPGTIGLVGPAGTNGKDGTTVDITIKNGSDDADKGIKGANGVDGKDGITRIVYEDANGQHQVATMEDGLKFAGDDAQKDATKAIAKKLNNTVDIIGGATGTLTDNNIGVNNVGGKLKVQLVKDLTGITSITSQTTGNTTGAKITLNTTDKNISVNDGKITDVKSGLTATDGTYAETDKSNAANIGDVHSMIEKEAGNTDTKLAEKANVDASNIGIHVSNDTAKQKENLDKWGAAIGTGEVADATNDHANQLVTGKTVYDALNGGLTKIVIGTPGEPGKDGAPGTIGLVGPAGKDGKNAEVDITIKQGSDDEAKGIKGANGVDGKDGITRIVYKDAAGDHQTATMEDGMKFAGDDGQTSADKVIAKKLNNTIDIIGGADSKKLTDKNIGVNNVGGKLKIQLAQNLTGITSIGNQKTTGEGKDATTTGAKITLDDNDKNISVNGGSIKEVASNLKDGKLIDGSANNAASISDVQTLVQQGVDNGYTNGDGITIQKDQKTNKNVISVNKGDGLKFDNGKLAVNTGDGLTVDETTKALKIKTSDSNLKVDQNGIGLKNVITIGTAGKDAHPITIDGTKGEVSGLNNTTWDSKVNYSSSTRAATESQVAQAMSAAIDQAGQNDVDTHVEAGTYAVGTITTDDGKTEQGVSLAIVDKSGKTTNTKVVITDVAKASDVGDVSKLADGVKNADGSTTTVVNAINNVNTKIGDQKYSTSNTSGSNKYVNDGDSITSAIGKLDGAVQNAAEQAGKHSIVSVAEGEKNISVKNIAKEGEAANYQISLNKDLNVTSVTATTVTTDTLNANSATIGGDKGITIKDNTVSGLKDTEIKEGSTNAVNGNTIWKELRPTDDGSYIKKDNTTAQNLTSLDTQVKKTADLINSDGSTIKIGGSDTATKIDISGKDSGGSTTARIITGVQTDAQDATSAANVGYVNDVAAANTQQIYREMHSAYGHLNNNINKAAAGSNALAALHPLDYDPADKASYAVGYGHYRNANAAAVGAFYQPNANTMVSVGVSMGNGDPGVNAGVSFKVGKGSAYNGVSKAQMAETIAAQEKQISEIKASDVAKDQRIDSLEKENQEMKKQIQEILAKLGK